MVLLILSAILVSGCRPPGARALLKGKALLEANQFDSAVAQLEVATGLLPTNALAYNYLGLALHQAGRLAEAERAYYRALALNHELAEARYNLGCLFLAQNRPEQAKSELTAFTLQRPDFAQGWVKLGTAQLRMHEPQAAERSFSQAGRLGPPDPEALTGIGLGRLQRNRPAEAVQCFNDALKLKPDYAPAVLNLAIVAQENLRDNQLALQHYRRYLALKPQSTDLAAVQKIARQLELTLAPPPLATVPAIAQITSNTAPKSVPGERPAPVSPANPTARAVPPLPSPAQKSSLVSRSQPEKELARTLAPTNESRPQPSTPAPKSVESTAASKLSPARTSAPVHFEVVNVPVETVFRPAGDVPARPAEPLVPAATTAANQPPTPPSTSSQPVKRTLLSKLNPARIFSGDEPAAATAPTTPSTPGSPDSRTPGGDKQPETGAKAFARYTYLSPPKPEPGNRSEAERAYTQAVKAQQRRLLAQAIQGYRHATQLDPAYFEACYNLGAAAAQAGDLQDALAAYEHALVIRPDSLDARYNFALALKQANFPVDARHELEKLLSAYPSETRVHLALGNLYAQQFHEPGKARAHYLKVLDAEPMHPQAGAIRYWLTANPAP